MLDTKKYYDVFSEVYPLIWDTQIHVGIFRNTRSMKIACQNTNKYLARKSGIKKGSTVINVGCGQGDTDIYLAKEFQCTVFGMDISEAQIEKAKANALWCGLSSHLHYSTASMENIPFDDGFFDYLWLQQSFFHSLDKKRAVEEFNRVLKRRGRVILENTILLDEIYKEEVLNSFGKRLWLPEILTADGIEKLFRAGGFKLILMEDLSNDLLSTYSYVLKKLKTKRKAIKKILDNTGADMKDRLDFQSSYSLVKQKKLGAVFMLFEK